MPNTPLLHSLFDESEKRPRSVSELNAEIRWAVEKQFSSVWVEGEVVNFIRAASGHWYFNLNDGTAQIKCVCWKGTNFKIRFRPENGISVSVRGRISFYEARGETQIVVESLEPAGEGALAAAFEQIKAKLDAEGLFDPALKRPLPYYPQKVAVVTSKTGAAYHDIHNVLTRRAGSVSILLVPTLVQGEGAADRIRQAVVDTNTYNQTLEPKDRIDVMIVGRGGGSAEDLWAFNDEQLARAIRSSDIPVISAVGHEIDWSVSDLVADLRAATPSAAAEMVAGREVDILSGLVSREERLGSLIEYKFFAAETRANDAVVRLRVGIGASVQSVRTQFAEIASKLTPAALRSKATAISNSISMLDQRISTALDRGMKRRTEALNMKMAKLDALSPLAVLTRGFSIAQTEDGRILRDAELVTKGDRLNIRLERGRLFTEVLSSDSGN